MDTTCLALFTTLGIDLVEGAIWDRDLLLDPDYTLYEKVAPQIPLLKNKFSSSVLTSLQKNAKEAQRWPLLNLVRQISALHRYRLVPIRKADGYTPEGIKRYKRFFRVEKQAQNSIPLAVPLAVPLLPSQPNPEAFEKTEPPISESV